MKQSKTDMPVELPPLRKLDDFLLKSANFQLPKVNDLERWGNRVAHNLIYYQTNYFLVALFIFITVGLFHPVKLFCGMLTTGVIFGIFCFFTNDQRYANQFKKDHPVICIVLVLCGAYVIAHGLGNLIVFLYGILLPITVIFIHASLRTRNLSNRVAAKRESFGLKRTPMGIFLQQLEIEPLEL